MGVLTYALTEQSGGYYAIQSGNFIVFVRKGSVAKAIAETLYTNNVLRVKK